MTCLPVNGNPRRILVHVFTVEVSDVANELSVLVVHQNHAPLGIGDINIVFSIYSDTTWQLELVVLSSENAEGSFPFGVKDVYGRNARIADNDALSRVGGHVLGRLQHIRLPIRKSDNGIKSVP